MIISTGPVPECHFVRLYDCDANNRDLSPISKLVISFLRTHTWRGPKDMAPHKVAWTLRLTVEEVADALVQLHNLGLITIESERK